MTKNNVVFIMLMLMLLIIALSVNAEDYSDLKLVYNINKGLNNRQYELENNSERLFIPEFYVRGIYVTGWVAGTSKMDSLINLVDNSIINTMVIDIKDQRGLLSHKSDIPLAQQIGANRRKIKNVKQLIQKLHSRGIYTIARIVVFKDMLLASNRNDLALELHYSTTGEILKSDLWVNPSKKEVWDYNIMIAREAAMMGFNEIQFDYIRFPAMGEGALQAVVPADKKKSTIINQFAQYASDQLSDLNIPISVDVFGMTTSVEGDLGIGQDFKELSDIINIMSPMVYPSHYSSGHFGLKIPEIEPYKVIYSSLTDAKNKVSGKNNIKIRPWLQDFTINHKYSSKEIKEQIKAVEELGIKEWFLWNPGSRYTREAIEKLPH
ncbi:MAG: putative glycoside hydrolase [Bacillota bacterium]